MQKSTEILAAMGLNMDSHQQQENSPMFGGTVPMVCEKHGIEYRAWINPCTKSPIKSCPKCREELEERGRKETADALMQEYRLRTDDSEIPQYFKQKSFADYQPENDGGVAIKSIMQEYARDFRSNMLGNRHVVMFGTMGTGKTHLACAAALEVIKQGFSARYTKAITFLRNVKSTWGKEAPMSEKAMIETYEKPDLLIIDELGMNFGTDAERVILFDLIDTRYGMMKPCILISNLSEEEFVDLIGAPLLNRMKDNDGIIFGLKWASKRG